MTPTPRCAGDGSSGSLRAPCPTEFLVQMRPTRLATTAATLVRCAPSPPQFPPPQHNRYLQQSKRLHSSPCFSLSLSSQPESLFHPFPKRSFSLPVTLASRRLLRMQNQLSVRTSRHPFGSRAALVSTSAWTRSLRRFEIASPPAVLCAAG